MFRLIQKIRDKHTLGFKVVLYVIAVAIVSYFLPSNTYSLSKQLERSNVWIYEDLVASHDFFILKSTEEIQQEKSQTQSVLYPYFKANTDLKSRKLAQFDALKNKLNDNAFNKLKLLIDSVYSRGIIERIDSLVLTTIQVVEYNEVKKTEYTAYFTVASAHDYFQKEGTKIGCHDTLLAYIDNYIEPFIVFDQTLTQNEYNQSINSFTPYKQKVSTGTVLVKKGQQLTSGLRQTLLSYEASTDEAKKADVYYNITGRILVSALVLAIMMLFLAFFRKAIFSQNKHVTFIFVIIVLMVFVSSCVYNYNLQYLYAIPFCLVPILIRIFFDTRTALFGFLNVLLLCAFFSADKFEFVFVQLTTGIGTIFSIAEMKKRSQLFVSAFITCLFYIVAFVAFSLFHHNIDYILSTGFYFYLCISSLCVLFCFPLIYFFEKLFGFISDFTLLELSDLNNPLLREFSQKVPGTFQHSLQVANLAEEAAYKIGGNPLLVRSGAMYHDIGKMDNPRYFTENQIGEVSPHDDLLPEESATIVIEHVIKGIEKAKVHQLPEQIIDFIRTHHGTTTTRFFLNTYKKEHAGQVINEDLFRYPGPIPFSKETAILMMADSVEAASRSLKNYDAISIDELVDRIINYQITENQFINSDITFRDINNVKKIFKKRLMTMYHVRIEYPR